MVPVLRASLLKMTLAEKEAIARKVLREIYADTVECEPDYSVGVKGFKALVKTIGEVETRGRKQRGAEALEGQ